MISYSKYKRERQHLSSGHQRRTYKKRKKRLIITPLLTQSNPWVGVDHDVLIY